MSEIKTPSCGRMIHYFPNEKDTSCRCNGATVLPATVIQSWGNLSVNIQVQTMNPDALNVLRYSVNHLSEVYKNEKGEPINSYWDWPEIK